MPELVRSEHDLPTIRIRLGGGGSRGRSEVEFHAFQGSTERFMVARCDPWELGLPSMSSRSEPLTDDLFRLPDEVAQNLRRAVDFLGHATMPPENAVWLELASPRGYLYLVPWERLFAQVLLQPVLRLPNHTLRPQAPSDALEIALCASSPMAKTPFDTPGELERLARLWVTRSRHRTRVHLFTDISGYSEVAQRTADLGPAVVIHDPHYADQYVAPIRTSRLTTSAEIVNPWLLWIRDSLHGQALDVVHFVTHGYLAGERGAIALASTPLLNTDTQFSRFVGSAETSALLAQVGAWCLTLTGPPDNYSGAGLRELADAIALVRPGVVLVDELGLDRESTQFAATVEMVFGEGPAVTQAMPAITCWAHPRFVEYPRTPQQADLLTADGRSSLIEPATHDALASEPTPAWVAAATRYLEAQQSEWVPGTTEAGEADPDAVAALRSVSKLLDNHVRRHRGVGPGGAM